LGFGDAKQHERQSGTVREQLKRKGTVYMEPQELGRKYDRIAQWWHEQHHASAYGMQQLAGR